MKNFQRIALSHRLQSVANDVGVLDFSLFISSVLSGAKKFL